MLKNHCPLKVLGKASSPALPQSSQVLPLTRILMKTIHRVLLLLTHTYHQTQVPMFRGKVDFGKIKLSQHLLTILLQSPTPWDPQFHVGYLHHSISEPSRSKVPTAKLISKACLILGLHVLPAPPWLCELCLVCSLD